MNQPSLYTNFQFLRLDPSYHTLMVNEKVVAKQDLLSGFDVYQRKMTIATYALTGLRPDCDVLIWRSGQSLEDFQAMSCRLQTSGMGKYLLPAYSFLGTPSTPPAGQRARYLFVRLFAPPADKRAQALDEVLKAAARRPSLKVHAADSAGLDDQDHLLAFETDEPRDYRDLAMELREPKAGTIPLKDAPSFTCILRDIRDVVDSFG
jgi:chlorite dismutase